tara:strand:- start:1435 stop:1800 length:366 start_codon:yes stop_codon:yes gene_type:complete
MEQIDFGDLQHGLLETRWAELLKDSSLDDLLQVIHERSNHTFDKFNNALNNRKGIKAHEMYAVLGNMVANQLITKAIVIELKKEHSKETYYSEIISDKLIDKLKALTKRVKELEEKNGKTN